MRAWLLDGLEGVWRSPARSVLALGSLATGFVCLALLQAALRGLDAKGRDLLDDREVAEMFLGGGSQRQSEEPAS